MVDALRRAHRMVTENGCVVDLHPMSTPASLEVGAHTIGHVDAGDASVRHAAAGAALQTVVDDGLFEVTAVVDFPFYTYDDTIEGLRDYIEETWRDARIGGETVQRARASLRDAAAGVRPRVLEQVRLTTLRSILS